MRAVKKAAAPVVNKGGRPRLGDEKMVVLPVRVPPDLRDKFYRIGGADRFRDWLKRCKEA